MRFSIDWLKRYLKTDKSISEICDALTFLGLEVEKFLDPEEVFKGFVVAQVSDVQKHPNADRLRTCVATLADGSKKNIVCGAYNLSNGLKVILALPGAKIPVNDEILKRSKIRGVVSEGMICSLEELKMAAFSDGIFEVPDHFSLSDSIDTILEIGGGLIDVSITPNRGDCFSVRGIARDLAAAGIGEFVDQDPVTLPKSEFDLPVDVSLQDCSVHKLSPFLAYRAIRGLKNKESPHWIKVFLKHAGVKSISAVVDLANFVMLDCGQPFHIYDLKKVQKGISIQCTKTSETFTDLHDRVHALPSGSLVAYCENTPLCLLGVIGSEECACDEETTDILIESAIFDPIYISTISSALNIVNDSKMRFERGVDPLLCVPALDALSKLIVQNCGGDVSRLKTFGELKASGNIVSISSRKLNAIAGCDVPFDKAVETLSKLGLVLKASSSTEATFETPSHRFDLAIEEDLIEEVLRVIGYNFVPPAPMDVPTTSSDDQLKLCESAVSLKKIACSCGLSEVLSFSFISNEMAELFGADAVPDSKNLVSITNPISVELATMRNSLYPNLLQKAERSLRFSNRYCNLFELGPVFSYPNNQKLMLSAIRVGAYGDRIWIGHDRSVDVFDIKSDMFACLSHIGVNVEKLSYDVNDVPEYYHPVRAAKVSLGNDLIGFFGEIHPNVRKLLNISTNAVGFEIFLDDILKPKKYEPKDISDKLYQSVDRDFSFVFRSEDRSTIHASAIVSAIRKVSNLIKSVTIFDYYRIDQSSIALGVSIKIQSDDSTMINADINDICRQVVAVAEQIGCELR